MFDVYSMSSFAVITRSPLVADIGTVVVAVMGSRGIEERNRAGDAIVFEAEAASTVSHGFACWVEGFVALRSARGWAIATCHVS